jgi:hypothetical protein
MSAIAKMSASTALQPRLAFAVLVLVAAIALPRLAQAAAIPDDPVRQTLEQARAAGNRGVTVHVQGSTVALVVTAIDGDVLVGRSAQHERIVVRIDRIDAVAF